MRLKKLTTAAIACVFVFGAAFGTLAMNNEKNAQAISAAVYDSDELAEYADRIAELVNAQRNAYGLNKVALSPVLCEAANTRAKELITSFSHTRPNGTSCFTAITELGVSYSAAAENIAYGQKSPESVMKAWMNSEGHRANILNADMEYIGVGAVYKNGVYYWSQFFAASEKLAPEVPEETAPSAPEVTAPPETEKKPSETTVTQTPRPAETTAPKPETEAPKPAETTAPKPETEAPKPAETTAPKPETEAPKPVETTAPALPCETQCSVDSDGKISCTPCTPCETQCSVSPDGQISCTPCMPCETECSVNSDGQISCTPCTPCETQCPADQNCYGDPGSGNCNTGNSCPLQNQGQNILEWLLPQIINSGNCNSSASNNGNCSTSSNSGSCGSSYGYSPDCNGGSCGNSRSNNDNYFFGVEKYIGGDSPTCWGN